MLETRLIISGALVLSIVIFGLIGRRLVLRLDLSPEQRQRTRTVLRHSLFIILVGGLLVVWADLANQAALVASGFAVRWSPASRWKAPASWARPRCWPGALAANLFKICGKNAHRSATLSRFISSCWKTTN